MIQDCTCVRHFAPPPLPPTPPRGLTHCTVPFLLKNPAHKQDERFKNNPHNKKKRVRGWTTGRKVGGWDWDMHPLALSLALSCRWRVVAGSGSPGWPSTSARHLESGFVVSRFSFVHNAPRGRMKHKCEGNRSQKPISCAAEPPVVLAVLGQLKTAQ